MDDIDTASPSGRLHRDMHYLFSQFDNQLSKDKSMSKHNERYQAQKREFEKLIASNEIRSSNLILLTARALYLLKT